MLQEFVPVVTSNKGHKFLFFYLFSRQHYLACPNLCPLHGIEGVSIVSASNNSLARLFRGLGSRLQFNTHKKQKKQAEWMYSVQPSHTQD